MLNFVCSNRVWMNRLKIYINAKLCGNVDTWITAETDEEAMPLYAQIPWSCQSGDNMMMI